MSDTEDAADHSADTASASGGQRPSLISLLAIGLSICALLVSVFEVSAIRDETRYQVWPFVSVGTSFSSEGYRVVVQNKGVGPAKIRSIQILLDGKRFESLDELIAASVGREDAFSYELYRTSNLEGGVMSADEAADLFAVPWEDRTRKLADAWGQRLTVELCYCSVYDECWVAGLNGKDPDEVSRCPDLASGSP